MLTHIYYSIAILFIIKELGWIYSPKEKAIAAANFIELGKINKGKPYESLDEPYKKEVLWRLLVELPLFLWLILGLLTFQWDAFLLFLIFIIIIVSPLSKLFKNSIAYIVLHWINSVVGLAFGIFVIINHYHLRISIFNLLFR